MVACEYLFDQGKIGIITNGNANLMRIHQSLDFLKQCQRFIQEMKLYGCTTEDMPNRAAASTSLRLFMEYT